MAHVHTVPETGRAVTPRPSSARRGGRLLLRLALCLAAGWLISLAATAGPPCAPDPILPLVLEGDAAPGTPDAFQTFDRPALAPTGAVAFGADTNGPSDGDDVVYVEGTLVAREGTPAPGIAGAIFDGFEFFETSQQVNASGQVVFVADLRDVPAAADRALYLDGALRARTGIAMPLLGGRVIDDLGHAGVTDDGTVGYLADLTEDAGDDSVIIFGGFPLFREGDAVPGLPGETWDGNFAEVQWNARGDVIFQGNTSLPTTHDVVVYRHLVDPAGGSVPAIVAQEGQLVAARAGDDFVDGFRQTALADDGSWAVRGLLELAPSDRDDFLLTGGGFYAQAGDAVPEIPGAVLGTFGGLDVNAAGDVVYLAALAGTPPADVEEGIFANGCLLVTDGAPVPGLPEGTRFADLGFEDVVVNDAREVVFAASYTGAATGDGLFRIALGDVAGCPGDLDRDGTIGFEDLLVLLGAWGACPGGGACPADLDGDGFVTFADVDLLLAAWGPC